MARIGILRLGRRSGSWRKRLAKRPKPELNRRSSLGIVFNPDQRAASSTSRAGRIPARRAVFRSADRGLFNTVWLRYNLNTAFMPAARLGEDSSGARRDHRLAR